MDQQTPPGNSYELEFGSYELYDLKKLSASLDQRITQSQQHREKNKKEFEGVLSQFKETITHTVTKKLDTFTEQIKQQQEENRQLTQRLQGLETEQLHQKNMLTSMARWITGTLAATLLIFLLYYAKKI